MNNSFEKVSALVAVILESPDENSRYNLIKRIQWLTASKQKFQLVARPEFFSLRRLTASRQKFQFIARPEVFSFRTFSL
jgi:hypothetical protein